MKNLMNEKLVWMTDEDFTKIMHAVNIATNFLCNYDTNPHPIVDLDGNECAATVIPAWEHAVHEAHLALSRTKYVPEEPAMAKLRLIFTSA
jgi:hypothetical protein